MKWLRGRANTLRNFELALTLAAACGLRRSEVLGLRRSDLGDGMLEVAGGSTRSGSPAGRSSSSIPRSRSVADARSRCPRASAR